YYYSHTTTIPKQTLVQNSSKTDILPGKTKATLTLDDGKKILLDDAKNAILAKQGTTIIDNLEGKLNYKGGASDAIRYNTLTTQKGEQYAITLNDGTEVFLDASSSIRFPVVFSGLEREVAINGRAYFHVASDKTKPFFVVKGDKKVRVYGTQFNVSAYDNESSMKVTLIQGSVKVINGNTEGMLLPSQQAVLSKNSTAISIVDNVDLEQCIAWKNGVIAIHHAEVNEILMEMERWYDIDIEIVGKLPKRDLYFDVSRKAKLSELLHILEIYHIKYSLDAVKRKLIVNS
ncbi:MAG: FecR domain-containing protein, partial [Bacteroidetes bacterium]|nr:FecR domain-containing protein [Bacteroidota bacterium]